MHCGVIEIENVSKRRGRVTVLDGVSFVARPGRVTGFIGPNGAGKSSTLRILLGLDHAQEGRALVDGSPFTALRRPLTCVGAVLDGSGAHRSRTGRAHLRWVAASNGLSRRRVEEVIELAGLESAAGKHVRGYSLGMGRRLGLAAALLGDPGVLVLDEPFNGLDAGGVRWVRDLVRTRARAGGTVLLSSHLMSELAEIVDDVVVISGGRIAARGTLDDVTGGHGSLEDAYFALTSS
ncbi:hypothetical protein GCM10010435_53600 [Winogradskya consettensis]|uniref:ABC transporter domain-containing protein n=1 Tax=Winogradskya consettensis TaxID=113560 RepID=A0A919SIY9_9ACTN|nr:hypothetical protein Aco04nite_25850 [Actinoplanes consettensis]